MNEAEREESEQAMARTFRAATDFAAREHARMLVLDEVCAAIAAGMLEEWDVLDFLDHKPDDLEVVMTGRNPDAAYAAARPTIFLKSASGSIPLIRGFAHGRALKNESNYQTR